MCFSYCFLLFHTFSYFFLLLPCLLLGSLRIAVNAELDALDALLLDVETGGRKVDSGGWLHPTAKIAVISFHSLEDRRVKQSFVALEKSELAKRLTRKPIRATDEEKSFNPRSRPAKLRVVQLGS